MDIQVLLIIILFILVTVVAAVGVYLIAVLKEFRQTVRKTNFILDDISKVTDTFSNPMTYFMKIFGGVMEGVKAVKAVTSIRGGKDDDEDD
jgi:hypothetical protein